MADIRKILEEIEDRPVQGKSRNTAHAPAGPLRSLCDGFAQGGTPTLDDLDHLDLSDKDKERVLRRVAFMAEQCEETWAAGDHQSARERAREVAAAIITDFGNVPRRRLTEAEAREERARTKEVIDRVPRLS